MRMLIALICGLMLVAVAQADDFTLTSTAFSNNTELPSKYTCDKGSSNSPQLSWKNAPADTKSFVLLFNSPDWIGNVYLWVLFNIPAEINELPEGANDDLPLGAVEGQNYFYGEPDYHSPCPPDEQVHHYIFTLYALDTILPLSNRADVETVLKKMRGHILKQTEIRFTYHHHMEKTAK